MRSAGRFPRAVATSVVVVLALCSSACDGDDSAIGAPPDATMPIDGSGPTTPTSSSPGSASPGSTTPATIPSGDGDDATVAYVVDGDTLRTRDDERVRLLNIDTPEPTQDECFADEATAHLESLLPPGTRIHLTYDRERFDRYGRTLAHVYRLDDGLWVNRQLALDGVAYPYVLQPNDARYESIRSAADDARAAGRGLWGVCDAADRLRGEVGTTTVVSPPADAATGDRTGCEPSYPTVCIPLSPPDLDCGDITARRFTVLPPDPHRFDGGGDGVGCESG